jgi:hypothetical protein
MKELTIFGKKIPIGILAAVLVLAGVGATAGAALSGDITGEGTTDVDQSLLVNDTEFNPNDGVAQVSGDRASFELGLELFQGDSKTINVPIDNQADTELTSRLVADAEEPLHLDVTGENNLRVQRVGPNEFILNAPANFNNDLQVTISAPNDINPGFYNFDFQLQPVEVGE